MMSIGQERNLLIQKAHSRKHPSMSHLNMVLFKTACLMSMRVIGSWQGSSKQVHNTSMVIRNINHNISSTTRAVIMDIMVIMSQRGVATIQVMVKDITEVTPVIGGNMGTGGDTMPTDTIVESAAGDYAANADWFDGKHIAKSNRLRAIRFFGLTGSAAEGDMSVELFVGSKRIGEFYNTATALIPAANSDLIPVGRSVLCPPGTDLHCFTKTVSGTNPAGITIVVDEL